VRLLASPATDWRGGAAAGRAAGRRRDPARPAEHPFSAPEAPDLVAAGLGARELAAAVRSGQLVCNADGVYLGPGIADFARPRLVGVVQPSTISQGRQSWGTSRRVAVPLMEWLGAHGMTVRSPDNTRRLR
jgi:selenocysteine-specific elongation factor